MAVSLTVNGVAYSFPQTGDESWGDNVTQWAQAVTSGMLQKAGGTFTLTADIDFGANFGLKSAYLKSRATNPAAAGVLRLGNAESLSWRNQGNTADLALIANSSNRLSFDSVVVPTISSTDTLTNKTISGASNTLTNIAYSSLVLSASVVNADIASAAAIAWSKMASLTASKALVSDGSGVVSASSVTSTELGYVSGVTSALQTQIDGKVAKSTATTKGDIFVATASATITRLAAGTNGTFLKANSSATEGVEWGSVSFNLSVVSKSSAYTATTSDDVILCDASSAGFTVTLPAASGNSGKVIRFKKTDSSTNTVTLDGNSSETIDGAATYVMTGQYSTVEIACDGSNWQIISASPRSYKESSSSFANYTITAGQWGDLTSLSLEAGEWDLSGYAEYYSNGAVTTVNIATGYSTSSGNVSPTIQAATSTKRQTNDNRDPITVPTIRVVPTSTTTYYLKGLATNSITNLQVGYRFGARRIR